MIKIAYCSDLHLEFSDRDFDLPDADILILAGDILVTADLDLRLQENKICQVYRKFLQDVSDKYQTVLYTGGNHEHYHGVMDQTKKTIDATLKDLEITNIIYEDMGSYEYGDTTFVFATSWTDCKNSDPVIMFGGARTMNDYRKISTTHSCNYGLQWLTPEDTVNTHSEHKAHIEKYTQFRDKVVVFTHHAPNMNSAMYNNDISYMYCSTDMDELILDHPQIKVWIHGHTHQANDYMIGETRILSNPRGYKGHEPLANEFQIKVIEV